MYLPPPQRGDGQKPKKTEKKKKAYAPFFRCSICTTGYRLPLYVALFLF